MIINLITYFVPPEPTPIAHRVGYIADEFLKLGHQVRVVFPVPAQNQAVTLAGIDLRPTKAGYFFHRSKRTIGSMVLSTKKPSYLKRTVQSGLEYFFWPPLPSTEWAFAAHRDLLKSPKGPLGGDFTIAFSLPLASLKLALMLRDSGHLTGTLVADCGDPFCLSDPAKTARSKEANLLNRFDAVCYPNVEHRSVYDRIGVKKELLHLIGIESSPPAWQGPFAREKRQLYYGGLFYRSLREPLNFLKALNLVALYNKEIRITVRSNIQEIFHIQIDEILTPAARQIVDFLPLCEQNEYYRELVRSDVGMVIGNTGATQVPSKENEFARMGLPYVKFSASDSPKTIFHALTRKPHQLSAEAPLAQPGIVERFLSLGLQS